jgi:hypothetical protein
MKLLLTNDFHKTECYVYAKNMTLTKSQVKKAKKKLCPQKDCQCSNLLGVRNSNIGIIPFDDGTVELFINIK